MNKTELVAKACAWLFICAASSFAFAGEVRSFSDFSLMDLPALESAKSDPEYSSGKLERVTNPARLYPPSCLSYPLPEEPSGPVVGGSVVMRGVNGQPLPVDVAFWRVPCSSSKSAFLVTMAAPGDFIIPSFFINQDGKQWNVRLTQEPNTRFSYTFFQAGNFIVTYPAEIGLLQYDQQGAPDLNREFSISAIYGSGQQVIQPTRISAYQSGAYPNVPQLIPLNGRMTGAYFQPGRGGEGILLEVAEAGSTSLVVVSWYTFDAEGFPFWLVGSAVYTPGATSVTVQLAGKARGGFGGQFDPAQLQDLPWGTITLRFPSCNTLNFDFSSTHSTQGLPVGSGSRSWSRLTSVNGFACE